MIDTSMIHPHMEVVGQYGNHVGTVEAVEGGEIKLARTHPRAGGQHHWIPLEWVAEVDGVVRLDRDADQARHDWHRVPETAAAGVPA